MKPTTPHSLSPNAFRLLIVAPWLAIAGAGCATADGGSTAGSRRASDAVIKMDPGTAGSHDPLTVLEQELAKVHSERVTVSTALLRSLVRNERLQQTECKNISGQLEAIKNVDLEETEEHKP